MPPAVSISQRRSNGVRTQAEHAREDIVLRLLHLSLPVFSWLGIGVLSVALRLAVLWRVFPGAWTAAAVAAGGLALATLDGYLRSHRQSWPGRLFGPATVVCCAGWLAAVVLAGWPRPLLLAYAVGGLTGGLGWILWMAHGDHRDLARAFIPAAETAFGLPGTRLSRIRRRRAGPAAPATTTASVQYPRGELVTAEAAARVEHLEAALGLEPGSVTLATDPSDAGFAGMTITSPRLLTDAPLPWPGPSAPGAGMDVPFRLGNLQDGREFLYDRLPIGHLKAVGATDSGKTMSLFWNMVAEGITRTGYAAFAADVVKGDQFVGALRPALHRAETTPEGAVDLLAGLHRARLARCNYLAAIHATEWFDGCGLSFCEAWLEEAAGILRLLGRTQKDRSEGRFMLEDWVEDVTAFRTAGMAVTASYQKPVKEQALSTVARSQMGSVCFGVNEAADAEFGLSELQRERGCRPQLWGTSHPGMAFWDTSVIPEKDKTLAMRHYFWGPGSARIAAYASEWPASRRKLDDVTGEALENRPARPASSGFPAPRLAPVPAAQDQPAAQPGPVAQPAPVAQLPGWPAGQPLPPPFSRRVRISPEEAGKRVRAQLAAWRAEGIQFTVRQLMKAVGEEVVCPRTDCANPYCTGRSRSWLYSRVTEYAASGLLAEAGGSPARYQVAGDPEGELA